MHAVGYYAAAAAISVERTTQRIVCRRVVGFYGTNLFHHLRRVERQSIAEEMYGVLSV